MRVLSVNLDAFGEQRLDEIFIGLSGGFLFVVLLQVAAAVILLRVGLSLKVTLAVIAVVHVAPVVAHRIVVDDRGNSCDLPVLLYFLLFI